MLVHSLWDQEDIYGNIAVWKALKARRHTDDSLESVSGASGPGTTIRSGSTAARSAPSNSAAIPQSISVCTCAAPVPRSFPEGRSAAARHSPRSMRFETGTNEWQSLPELAARLRIGLHHRHHKLYTCQGNARQVWRLPAHRSPCPASRPTCRTRRSPFPTFRAPFTSAATDGASELADLAHQRPACMSPARTDVLSFSTTDVLDPPDADLSGEPIANLMASDDRHGWRLRRQAYRRLSGPEIGRDPGDGRLPADGSQQTFLEAVTARISFSKPTGDPFADQKQTYQVSPCPTT